MGQDLSQVPALRQVLLTRAGSRPTPAPLNAQPTLVPRCLLAHAVAGRRHDPGARTARALAAAVRPCWRCGQVAMSMEK